MNMYGHWRHQLKIWLLLGFLCVCSASSGVAAPATNHRGRLVYIVSDGRIPFWRILARGITESANKYGYKLDIYTSENDAKLELQAIAGAIALKPDGIIISPTNSSACTTLLKLAEDARIPVVIADIGTDGGHYVSYISSDNFKGAYELGRILAGQMKKSGAEPGTVGIVAIPQKRANGQARTAGFMRALREAGIESVGMRQQATFSYRETYDLARELIAAGPNLRVLWLQGSDRYQAALDAIADAGKKGDIFLITFDAEPEFLSLIPAGVITAAGMQQPYLIGEQAVEVMHRYLLGESVQDQYLLDVLAVSAKNIQQLLPVINRNVLGLKK